MINMDRYSTITQTQAHEKTSDRFGFVPTSKMLEILADSGWMPSKVRQASVRREDYEGFQTHVVRLQHQSRAEVPVIVGEYVPELVLKNSHLGGCSFQLMWGVYRYVCSNGMTVGEDWGQERIRHVGFAADKAEEAVRRLSGGLPKLLDTVEGFRNTKLNDNHRLALAGAAVELLKDDDGKYSIEPRRLLETRRWADRSDQSLWGTFNTIQENVIRGGVRRTSTVGRSLRTRAVNSPDRDLKLNRALWTLAEALQKHIQ